MYILKVLVEYSSQKLDRTFDYLSNAEVKKGCRVKIQFGYQHIIGYVEDCIYTTLSQDELQEEYGFKMNYIEDVIDEQPLLSEELQELASYLARQTLSSRISCLQSMLPPTLKPSSSKGAGKLFRKVVYFQKDVLLKTKKQQEALAYIKEHDGLLSKNHPVSPTMLKTLEKQGGIVIKEEEYYREITANRQIQQDYKLTQEQEDIVTSILHRGIVHHTYLLHGVTGAGKTEVYLHLARKVIDMNKTVLMLVPEIALTPMMVDAFISRFGRDVAILHSKLSSGQRYDEYRRIQNQEVKIVVGARSAIFAPLENIGLIILDEEHDASYKQENAPRYTTHQIARYRGKKHDAIVLFASATPSLESYSRALKGIYSLCTLSKRINTKPLPPITLINMEEEIRRRNYGLLSLQMEKKIQECLDCNEQVMLLLNKRGYASYQQCSDCKEVLKCPHCDVTLTYHKANQRMECHYCQYSQPVMHTCTHCGSKQVKMIGTGTQKIEEYLQNRFLNARVLRYDVDTTRKKDSHRQLLEKFEKQEANILVGTQMIAKGLDFENVTFVGVLNADLSLNFPDFRANERTFQLLEQVSGRSGRGKKEGCVYIQTYNPDHFVLQCVQNHDYIRFYQEEMKSRKLGMYPPFSHLVSLLIQSKDEKLLQEEAMRIKKYLDMHLSCRILGPTNCTIYKLNDYYRMRITLKITQTDHLYDALSTINDQYNKNGRKVNVVCDFNPYTTL